MRKLEKKYIISGIVRLETGLMIGSSSAALEIGGTDKQIVRHPITKLPYIPGSSLKGKMRSLIELTRGEIGVERDSFGPTQNPEHLPAQLFGHINRNTAKKQQPSRLIIRDGMLLNKDFLKGTELPYTEIKAENSIDRITAAANPRFFERVPKGAEFELNMVLNVFDKETDKNGDKFLGLVFDALRLVQDDYLGGGGSRGNGQVSFRLSTITEKTYGSEGKLSEKPCPELIPDFLKSAKATA
jgi:CRISPR-associated protein Csm3